MKNLFIAVLLFCLSSLLSTCAWAVRDESLAVPPKVEPYKLPTFEGKNVDYHTVMPIDAPNADLDADTIYETILACYPHPSHYKLDVELRLSASDREMINVDNTRQGKYYAEVVAKMPLYSTTEIERLNQMEIKIRESIAKNTALFNQAISMSITAHRQFGLYSSLESRSQTRVKQGIADTQEQIGFLEKVIAAQTLVSEWDAKLDNARIELIAMCRETEKEKVSWFLFDYIEKKGVKFLPKVSRESKPKRKNIMEKPE